MGADALHNGTLFTTLFGSTIFPVRRFSVQFKYCIVDFCTTFAATTFHCQAFSTAGSDVTSNWRDVGIPSCGVRSLLQALPLGLQIRFASWSLCFYDFGDAVGAHPFESFVRRVSRCSQALDAKRPAHAH